MLCLKFKGKIIALATLPALVLMVGGCGGINTTQSVSPASFFLPGLLKADPPAPLPEALTLPTEPENQVAVAR